MFLTTSIRTIPRFCGNLTKNMLMFWTGGVLDLRCSRWYFTLKFGTTRLATYILRPNLLLGPKTTFHRLSGHIAWRTWLWSSSGYFCVSCPCSLRLFRRGSRLPSLSLWTATSRSLYLPVAKSVSSRPWEKMPPWKLNTRLDVHMFCPVYNCVYSKVMYFEREKKINPREPFVVIFICRQRWTFNVSYSCTAIAVWTSVLGSVGKK